MYVYGRTDGEGEPLYDMLPIESKPTEIERKPHESLNVNDPTDILIPMEASPGSCFYESHRRDHRVPMHLHVRLRQKRRLHPRLHRRHRK